MIIVQLRHLVRRRPPSAPPAPEPPAALPQPPLLAAHDDLREPGAPPIAGASRLQLIALLMLIGR